MKYSDKGYTKLYASKISELPEEEGAYIFVLQNKKGDDIKVLNAGFARDLKEDIEFVSGLSSWMQNYKDLLVCYYKTVNKKNIKTSNESVLKY